MGSQFFDMTSSSKSFDVALHLLSSLVTVPSFISILSLVLQLRQFSFIRDWPEIQESEITPSVFCPISGDWGNLRITNLAQMSLIKCYRMPRNTRATALTIWVINGKPTSRIKLPLPHRLGLNLLLSFYSIYWNNYNLMDNQ